MREYKKVFNEEEIYQKRIIKLEWKLSEGEIPINHSSHDWLYCGVSMSS